MNAILRTYLDENKYTDTIVEVDDEHTFISSFAETVPFSVGSNQVVLPVEELTHKELMEAVHNTSIDNF